MDRYIVGAEPAVLTVLRAVLLTMPERFSVVSEVRTQMYERIVVETTNEGAQALKFWLEGVGVVERDTPLNP